MTRSRVVFLPALLALIAGGCGGSGNTSPAAATTSAAANTSASGSAGSPETFDRSNWATLASDPDAHKGAHVTFVGKVFVNPETDAKGTYMQVWADPQDSQWNTIVAYPDSTLQVQDGDFIRVSGTVRGAYHGKNAFGADVVATTVVATSVKVVDATAAAPPALSTYGRVTFTKSGITITIRKIEASTTETRVFVSVNNRSQSNVSVYGTSMKLVAGGRQLDPSFSTAGYPELSSDLVPGAFTSGVVVFPKISPNEPVKLYVDAHSDDYNVGNYGTLTYIFTWQ